MDYENLKPYDDSVEELERYEELKRIDTFNSFVEENINPDEFLQRNEKQNQNFYRTSADQFLNDKQVYHVKVTHLHNYVDERRYYGNMIKSVYSKEERERKAYDRLCDLLGKDNVTIEDAEKYIQDNSISKKYSEKGSVSDKISNHNYYRSYLTLRNYALANTEKFKSFITLTFAENIQTSQEANSLFNVWCLQVRRVFPEFAYIGVPERQKRGAIHYHLMTNIIPGSDLIPRRKRKKTFNRKTQTFVELDYYDIKFWNYGISSAFDLDMTDDNFSVVSYLAKYFWKEKDNSFFGKKKILRSLNLNKPLVEFMNINSEAYRQYKQSLMDAVLIKSTMIEASTDYCPDVEINEYKKV